MIKSIMLVLFWRFEFLTASLGSLGCFQLQIIYGFHAMKELARNATYLLDVLWLRCCERHTWPKSYLPCWFDSCFSGWNLSRLWWRAIGNIPRRFGWRRMFDSLARSMHYLILNVGTGSSVGLVIGALSIKFLADVGALFFFAWRRGSLRQCGWQHDDAVATKENSGFYCDRAFNLC